MARAHTMMCTIIPSNELGIRLRLRLGLADHNGLPMVLISNRHAFQTCPILNYFTTVAARATDYARIHCVCEHDSFSLLAKIPLPIQPYK